MMFGLGGSSAVVPRAFKLQEELKHEEAGGDGIVNYRGDIYMHSWTGTIIGPHNSVHEDHIYWLKLLSVGAETGVVVPYMRWKGWRVWWCGHFKSHMEMSMKFSSNLSGGQCNFP